jgi:NADH-quinone oxidoreductase subunit E
VLNEQEKASIDKEIAKFPKKRHACLDALLTVQKHRGFISDETLVAVATYLEMSPTELDGIATFYNLIFRKPVGTSVIRLCDSVSCWIMGYENIRRKIKEYLNIDWGMTTLDNKFTLLPAQCLGVCDKAPAMMINAKLYTNIDADKLQEVLSIYDNEEGYNDSTSDREDENRRPAAQSKRISLCSGV